MTRTLKAHFESGKLVFDETLPSVGDGTPVAVTIDFPSPGSFPVASPWAHAALDSAFRDDENWENLLDGFIAEDRA